MTSSAIITEKMTAMGAVNKSFILFGIMLLTSAYSYTAPKRPVYVRAVFLAGWPSSFLLPLKNTFLARWRRFYAALEGLFVGSVTAMYAGAFGGGIVFHAVTLTLAILFMMLFLYKTGVIKVTEKFRSAVMMATGAIFLVYLLSWILGMFGMDVPFST